MVGAAFIAIEIVIDYNKSQLNPIESSNWGIEMYLKSLMQGEKYAFYSVVMHMVSIDGVVSDVERTLVNGFLDEMDLSEEGIPDISFDDAIDMFTYSSFSVRKKVYFELVGVALCDELLHVDEKGFLEEVALRFKIDEGVKNSLFETVQELLGVYKKMQAIVDNDEE